LINRILLVLFVLSCFAFSQAPAPKTSPGKAAQPQVSRDPDAKTPAQPPVPTSNVPADEAVITIAGVCPAGTAADACVTKITRAQFEELIKAMNPNIPLEARASIAKSYGQLIAMSTEAQKRGVDKDPAVQVQMRVQQMSMMAQALQKKVLEDSKPTEQEIEAYRTENAAKYEEIDLKRIVILKSTSSTLKPEELKALAEKIRERAAAGEDTEALEAEAYKTAKSGGTPPSTNLGWKKRGSMDPRHEQQIITLKAGEVSPVMEDAQAYYIYKVAAKRVVPMETVHKEIEQHLQSERAQKAMKALMEGVKPQLNEAYFGPSEPPKQLLPPATQPK
jgi:hypothetical protein